MGNMQEFREALKKVNFEVSDQELITIMRKSDPNGDGQIRYDEFCAAVLEEDYKQVESHGGGQITHGEKKLHAGQKQELMKAAEDEEHKMKQERLNELLGAFREQLFPYKDQIQPMFAAVDTNGDGHVNYDDFKKVLEQMGVQVDEQDLELLVESFFDPDVEDQTRPMSIAVLDEALFG